MEATPEPLQQFVCTHCWHGVFFSNNQWWHMEMPTSNYVKECKQFMVEDK